MDRNNDQIIMESYEYTEFVKGQHLLSLIVRAQDANEKTALEFLLEQAKEYVEGL